MLTFSTGMCQVWHEQDGLGRGVYLPALLLVIVAAGQCLRAEEEEPSAPAVTLDGQRTVEAVRVPKGPTLDGRLDDEVWKLAKEGGPFIQVEPVEGAVPSEHTEFRVVYDDDALYIGLWCFDSEPEKIIASEMARDGELTSDDYVSIVMDTFRDRRNGYRFRVNANGAQADYLISNNSNINEEWDGIWRVAASIDEEGWKAEVEIPFKTLSFDPSIETWGLNFSRGIRRKSERARWSGASQNLRSYNVAAAGELTGLRGIEHGLGLELVPYGLTRYTDDRVKDDEDLIFDGGGDLRYRITPNLTASLSYNTDFAETEVDLRQINLTRFPLFFPEKRDFFLEDEGIFRFANLGPRRMRSSEVQLSTGSEIIPFFSRRIGLTDDGEPVPIVIAGKMTGRMDRWNVGFLDALVDSHDDIPQRNTMVGRVSRNIFDQSSVGGLVTWGDPNSQDDNFVGGMDFNFRTSEFLGDNVLEASVYGLGSVTEGLPGRDNFAFGGSIDLPNDLYRAGFQFFQIEENFNPALGFVSRNDVRAYFSTLSYRPRPESVDFIRQLFFTYSNAHFTDLSDGDDLDTALHSIFPLFVRFESFDELFFNFTYEMDSPDEDFEISEGVIIAPGEYWWPGYTVGFESARRRPVKVDFRYTFGDFYDGERDGYMVGIELKPIPYIGLRLDYALDVVRLPEGDFETRLGSVSARFSLSPQLNWFNLIQYDNVTDTIGYNSRIHWEYRPGANIYLVLNQNIDRNHGRLRWLESALTLKVGVSFRF